MQCLSILSSLGNSTMITAEEARTWISRVAEISSKCGNDLRRDYKHDNNSHCSKIQSKSAFVPWLPCR